MSTYRLRPEGMALMMRDHRRMVYGRIPLMVVALGVGIAIPPLAGMPLSPVTLSVLGVIGLGVMVFSVWSGLRKAEYQFAQHFETYSLELDDRGLSHHSAILPAKQLGRGEVARIEESSLLGLVVRGRKPGDVIVVSPHLQGYDEVRSQLAVWRDIEALSGRKVQRQQQLAGLTGIGLSLVFIALWVGVGWSPDIRLAMACGAVMCVGGIFVLRSLHQRIPGINLKPLVGALIFFSLSIPARLLLHYWRP
ncbi:hypothetical protein [Hyalangium rubrum]|uniref:Uncharacterized protein n=1 Tax=Hyalangium rubrum TaxID=3103134 RepID=A0ABU5HEU6_9BACT|nr:hypothetical protein [Hyalangium sp. s54d21]MDY7231881.1 hypothetical protein [Hyalangium sp. s54d21]